MKRKYLFLPMAAFLAAGGLWLAQSSWRMRHSVNQKSSMGGDFKTPDAQTKPGQMLHTPARLLPPVPNRRFTDFTPEQRVEFARKGHGPGG